MRSDDAIAGDEFVQYLDRWANRCPWCFAEGYFDESTDYTVNRCTREDVEKVRSEYKRVKKGIRYKKYSVCYEYGVPQSICDRFEANGDGGWKFRSQKKCQYPGVIIGAISSLMTANINRCGDAVWEWMRLDQVDERHPQQVLQWMGRKIRWGGMEAAMINKVFY